MAGRSGAAVVFGVHADRILAAYRLDVVERRLVYPGSAIKPFTLMALLESGKLDAETALMCRRPLSIAGRKLDCSHPDTKQPLDAATALAYSCNSYFATVALRLTPDQLYYAFVNDAGLNSNVWTPQYNGPYGTVSHAQSPDQLQLQALGEWGVKVTPLGLAQAYHRLAALQPKHDLKLAPLFEGLEGSVAYGMGHAAQPDGAMKVAGKTGTSSAEEGAWTHAWFAGYAPAENPEIVVVVFLEKGHGGSDAATVAREIFTAFAQSRNAPLAATKSGGAK